MKRALLVLLLLLPSLSALAADSTAPLTNFHIQPKSCIGTSLPKIMSIESKEQIARSGCCSHHQGVCGCEGGRQVCCDGSFSPSCTCNKEEPPTVLN